MKRRTAGACCNFGIARVSLISCLHFISIFLTILEVMHMTEFCKVVCFRVYFRMNQVKFSRNNARFNSFFFGTVCRCHVCKRVYKHLCQYMMALEKYIADYAVSVYCLWGHQVSVVTSDHVTACRYDTMYTGLIIY